MRCEEVIDLMNRELDGDLTEEEQQILHHHVQSCSDCTELFARLQAVSAQLQALPKVTPPLNIVDSILPSLAELDKMGEADNNSEEDRNPDGVIPFDLREQRKSVSERKKPWAQKRWWIPGSVVAAGFLIMYISTLGPFNTSLDQTTQESAEIMRSAPFSSAQGQQGSADNHSIASADQKSAGVEDQTDPDEPQMGALQLPGADDQEASGDVTTENVALHSPNGEFVAQPGYEDQDIRINLKNGEPYYMTNTKWKKPWEIYSMEWVNDDELYFVLFNTEAEEYQYWLVNAQERSEDQLERPYLPGRK